MQTKIKKWGNSLALRLPKGVTAKHALKEGSRVVVIERDGGILIKNEEKTTKRSLKDLVGEITEKNTHNEATWDTPRGKEVW